MIKFNSSHVGAGQFLSFKDSTGQSVDAQITGADENSQQITATVLNAANTVQVNSSISVNLSTGEVLHGNISSPDEQTLTIDVTGVTSSFDIDSSSGARGGAAGAGIIANIKRKQQADPAWRYKK